MREAYWSRAVMMWFISAEGKVKLSHFSLGPSGARLLRLITSMLASNGCIIKLCFLCAKFCFPYRSACWLEAACMWLPGRLAHVSLYLLIRVTRARGQEPASPWPPSLPSTGTPGISFSVTFSLILLDTCVSWHLNMLHPAWGTCATDEVGDSNKNRNNFCPSCGSFSLSSVVFLAGQRVLWKPVPEPAQ